MRQLRQLLAVKVIRQQGHIREGRRRSPDSNRQTENRLKQLLEILSHSRRQGKKSPSQGQSRCPIHDRQIKRIRRLSQHLRTLRSRKLLIRNHPIRKAEQIIMGNLHPLRLASRSRCENDVIVIISLHRMAKLIRRSLSESCLNLLRTKNRSCYICQRKIIDGNNQAWLSNFHNRCHALQG